MSSLLTQPLQWPLWSRALLFKTGWLSLVLWQNIAAIPVLCMMVWLWWRLLAAGKSAQLQAIVLLTVVGLAADFLLFSVGWLSFQDANPWYYAVVWGWFATAWHWCFVHWFGKGAALVVFAALVPFAYVGGAALGNDIAVTGYAIYVLGPVWFCLLALSQWQLRYATAAKELR